MNIYLVSIPAILLVVVVFSHRIYLINKAKKETKRVNTDIVQAIRLNLVRYLNQELSVEKRIDPMKLQTKCNDLQDLYVEVSIWTDVIMGFVSVDIRLGEIEAEITCYQEVPEWNRAHNQPYLVV